MLVTRLVVVGLVSISLAFSVATAEDAAAPGSFSSGAEGVSFADIGDYQERSGADRFSLDVLSASSEHRYPQADFSSETAPAPERDERNVELALTGARLGGGPLDVTIAQRASVGFNQAGDIESRSQGREVRVGTRLADRVQRSVGQALGIGEWRGGRASWDNPTWYLFASSDDETVAFRGGQIALQDQVQVGDFQAGVTMERGPLQASLAYIERETSTQIGRETYNHDQKFAGFTLTWRH